MTAKFRPQNMRGRTVLITGATGGIGYQTALALARGGAHVIITGRDIGRGENAAAMIARASDRELVTFLQADHSTVGGNQQLADQVRAAFPGLDVLVNNVGGLYKDRWETADGYEATLAMNFVGPVALTRELLPLLQVNAPSRCVSVVSAAFQMWKRDPFEDEQPNGQYVSGDIYAQTKLLNVLFSLALARRVAADHITVTMVHPGVAWTELTQATTPDTLPSLKVLWPILRLIQRLGSPERAAQRVVFLASSPRVVARTGEYFEGKQTPKRLSARELDLGNQQRAWQLACELVADAPTGRRSQLEPPVHPSEATDAKEDARWLVR